MALAQQVGPTGHVHAVEPNPRLLPCLSQTVAGLSNTTLHECAVGEFKAEMTLYVPEGDHGQGSLANWTIALKNHTKVRTHRVPVVRLADLVRVQPTLMKVDVEGAEALVLRGALPLLDREDAPVILFEELTLGEKAMQVQPHAAADLLRSLSAPNYSLEIVEHDGSRRPYTTEHDGWINVLAVPASRRLPN
jgi:FkbM family methyltransferase